jgi:hypothetical protein
MEKFQALYNQNLSSIRASEGLATILNQQRNPKLKIGLGYEEGSSSGKPRDEEPIKFVKCTTNDNNKHAKTKEDNQPPRMSKEKGARTESVEQRNSVLPAERLLSAWKKSICSKKTTIFQVQRIFLWLLFLLF